MTTAVIVWPIPNSILLSTQNRQIAGYGLKSMNPDKPFVLRGGTDPNVALYNRIAVIERIKYLTGIDMREKSVGYLRAFSVEMWIRFYHNESVHPVVDEDFCQRAATVIRQMDQKGDTTSAEDKAQYDAAYADFERKKKTEEANVSQHAQGNTQNVAGSDQQIKD